MSVFYRRGCHPKDICGNSIILLYKKAVLHIGCATLLNHIQASGFALLPIWRDHEGQPLLILFRSE